MKMIRPYGQSVVQENDKQRKIKEDKKGTRDILTFAQEESNIILGLAISTLDKIIKKPKEGSVPEKIYNVREQIGKHILQILIQEVSIFKNGDNIIQDKWERKLHPYGKKFKEDKNGQPKKEKSLEKYQGRHYKKFIGTISIEKLLPNNTEDIAKKIRSHIFKKNLIVANPNLKGILSHTSQTIEKNILKINDKKELKYTQADLKEYILILSCERNEDFALSIYNFYSKDKNALEKYKAEYAHYITLDKVQKEKDNIKHPSRPTEEFTTASVMKKLKDNYECCFEGKKITDLINENNPEFYAHEAVRDFYKKLLERHRNKKNIDHLIPKDTKALIEKLYPLTENIVHNQNLNNDIRFGKIIHYTKLNSTKEQIENSKFWSSEGQKYIKRSEAFIKSWFNFITFASHSLTYLADSEKMQKFNENFFKEQGFYPDILVTKGTDGLCTTKFGEKLKLVLADNHGFDNNLEVLFDFFRKKLSDIRNNSFHFKDIKKMEEIFLKPKSDITIQETIKEFYKNDAEKVKKNLWTSLEAVGIKQYSKNKTDIENYWHILTGSEHTKINLPKFRTLLKRAENTKNTIIPAPKVGQDVGKEYQCQYLLLKNLYDIPFRTWFAKTTPEQLEVWIETTKTRLTKASEDLKQFSISLEHFPSKFEKLSDYFEELMRLETQKGSVQNGYASDKTAQKKKANTVENFKIEVLIYAFKDYLRDNKLDYLERGLSGTQEIVFTPNLENNISFDLWQQELYVLLHLVPVGIACDLEHQLIKYLNLVPKEEATSKMQNQIIKVFELYRQNNDVKFEGSGKKLPSEIEIFYADNAEYKKIFLNNPRYDDNQEQAQHRHLREMVRFGLSDYLKDIAKQYAITQSDIDDYLNKTDNIAEWQKERTSLHAIWVTEKEKFLKKDDYKKVLNEITIFNQLDNHVRLVNHRKIHNLIMRILGRLAGFSFVYERDLYFMTLAHCYSKLKNDDNDKIKNRLEEFFGDCKIRKNRFTNGQIITALDLKCPDPESRCKDCLPKDIPVHIQKMLKHCEIRNDFAHFNMLINENKFNLLNYINQARTLMSYDRKLKNAVAKSMIGLCQKENIEIDFKMDGTHTLTLDKIQAFTAYHLKETKNNNKNNKKEKNTQENKNKAITEELHSEEYITMVKALFGVPKPS